MRRTQPLHGIRLSSLKQRFELVPHEVIEPRRIYLHISIPSPQQERNVPEVKSSSSPLYIHIKIFLSWLSGWSSFLPSTGGGAKIGRMSGLPKENVVEGWLKTESKETGLCFHPAGEDAVNNDAT